MRPPLRRHRYALSVTLTVLVVLAALLLNVGLTALSSDNLWFADTTPEGLYTPTDALIDTCKKLKGEVTVTFCQEPDRLTADYELRYVYYLAKALANRIENITLVTCDIVENPTAVDPYRATTATVIRPDDVIISCGGRYRIYSASSFWTLGEDSQNETDYYSFNGEYKMATAFLAITSVVEPVVCFAYTHGEHIYVDPTDTANASLMGYSDPDREAFWALMRAEGLKVSYIDLDTEKIPEDCVMVVIDGPTVDYELGSTTSLYGENALTRLHAFLADRQGALMVFKDPAYTLPNLEAFVADWGIGFENDILVQDPTKCLTDGSDVEDSHRYEKLIVNLSQDEESVANAIYADIAALGTAPRTVVANSGTVYKTWLNDGVGSSSVSNIIPGYFEFFTTSDSARRVTLDGRLDSLQTKSEALAAVSMRIRYDKVTNDYYYSYCFGAATTALTENTYLSNHADSNYDVMFALVRYISRTDEYASTELGGTSLNSENLGGKPLLTVTIDPTGNVRYDDDRHTVLEYYQPLTDGAKVAWTVALVAVPVLLAAAGAVLVTVRRRNR